MSALLGEAPPAMPVRRLVRVARLFGINENQARVALSRMVARGEVVVDEGGDHALAGRLAERARRLGTARRAATGPYDGSWHVVAVTASGDDAATRKERRAALRGARLGELREGVWVRPANLALDLAATLGARAFRAVPETDARSLAHEVFDLAGWDRRARRLCGVLEHVSVAEPGSLAVGFELSAEVLRHLQRDPLMPRELLDARWSGDELRERYDAFDTRYRTHLADAHRALASASTR